MVQILALHVAANVHAHESEVRQISFVESLSLTPTMTMTLTQKLRQKSQPKTTDRMCVHDDNIVCNSVCLIMRLFWGQVNYWLANKV